LEKSFEFGTWAEDTYHTIFSCQEFKKWAMAVPAGIWPFCFVFKRKTKKDWHRILD
jgi:hypothetical protein